LKGKTMRTQRGLTLVEILISTAIVAIAAMAAVAYVTRASEHATWSKDRIFARQKALSILAEMRAFVEGAEGEVAAELDDFDDGLGYSPSLSIAPNKIDQGAYIDPKHPLSDNQHEAGAWRWLRQISVRPYPGTESRDLRVCTVRVFRMRANDVKPGEKMAEVSSVIRTVSEGSPSKQVYDVYLIALDNVPGWWVHMGAIQPFVEAALLDLEVRNPGLEFRPHWITSLGYGRDEEYAPYINEERDSHANTPWTYVYPGTMPAGAATQNYYVPDRMQGRMNLDGEYAPTFVNGLVAQEPYVDANSNGFRDPGEMFTDLDGDGAWDGGNPVPYALADMHNHCMRLPDALARFDARVAAGVQKGDEPTLRLLLDRMLVEPERYKHAILVNLHGELLPMPPTRNYSDAAKDPERRPGWRVVTHPERLRPHRDKGNDMTSDAPVYRVHAYKSAFPAGHEPLMTQEEPFLDANRNGQFDDGESWQDWNGNGARDAGIPISIVLRAGTFHGAPLGTGGVADRPNEALNPSIVVERLPGGIDADADSMPDEYRVFENATRYPETFSDDNSDGVRQVAEAWLDLDGNGVRNASEPHQELDGDGTHTLASESLVDGNGNGHYDAARPAETFTDANANGRWDAAEPYWDRNGNGMRDGPTLPSPPAWVPWNSELYGNQSAEDAYVAAFGEPFQDLDGDQTWDAAEAFYDANQNGVCDGGFQRGEMWFRIDADPDSQQSLLRLYGTPLEAPEMNGRGLPAAWRLYDLEYVPCPTPNSSGGSDRFLRDLAWNSDTPKNTARWRITLPLASLRGAYETSPGLNDGDAQDLLITTDTRIGEDLTTGTMWPVRSDPQNLSRAYTWFYASAENVPFSERYQMRGDPRHCPYADTDTHGDTAPNGYNWGFDNLRNGDGDYSDAWKAFEKWRLRDGWRSRSEHDVPRMLSWLRKAIIDTQGVFTTMSGFSFYYMSVGGDVGYDEANGYSDGIPINGLPHGLNGTYFENTLGTSPGSPQIAGGRKYVRSSPGSSAGRRDGGYWWSKPWLGELFDDADYATQWKPWGNLRASTSGSSSGYHLVRRDEITSAQMPQGTSLLRARAELRYEGCTSFFNIGTTSSSTFHHQLAEGTSGNLIGDGSDISKNYGYPIPSALPLSRPFHLAASAQGGVGSEWSYTSDFPRHGAQLVTRFYDHSTGANGSALVRLQEPGSSPQGGYCVISGMDQSAASGSPFIARYTLISTIHSIFAAGLPGGMNRITQIPRVEIKTPDPSVDIVDPASIQIEWNTKWKRWDAMPYTSSYPADFAEDEGDIVYQLLYSTDNGTTWHNMRDDSWTQTGTLAWIDGMGPDTAKTFPDWNPGANETWTWLTPATQFPEGSYLIRVEAYRRDRGCHYAAHEEKIHVQR
jgi:prepilin-type N-terminal cleavage/methylation domain-containing protein